MSIRQQNIVYKAKVTSSNQNYQEKVYFGSCETTFKKRFSNHKKSFNLKEYKNETELSNEIWRIKNPGHHPKVKWEIVKKCVSYSPQTKRCLLRLNEKLEILHTTNRTYWTKETKPYQNVDTSWSTRYIWHIYIFIYVHNQETRTYIN